MKWITLFSSVLLCVDLCLSLGDPYKILGIHKSALAPEIRKAYKQLAKEWHPDKNSDPGAEDKFVEITQAYELLSDPERRRQYDTFGRTGDPGDYPRGGGPRGAASFDPVDDLFAQGFRFRYPPPDRDITLFHKMSVSARAFENVLMPKSHRQPYLLLFYSDWCFACLQMEPVWRRVTDELEPIGVGVATVHTEHEPMLTRRVGVHGLPCLAILIEGKTYIYKQSVFSIQKVVEFVRHRLPYRLVTAVTDDTVDDFLAGWSDNLVRGLLFQKNEPIRLRYLLTVFYHRDRVAFGFVQTSSLATAGIRRRYQAAQADKDALLLFNENAERPAASVAMADIPPHTMHDIINNNKYLLLPRLSSQSSVMIINFISLSKLILSNYSSFSPNSVGFRSLSKRTFCCGQFCADKQLGDGGHKAALPGGAGRQGRTVAVQRERRAAGGQCGHGRHSAPHHARHHQQQQVSAPLPHEAVVGELIDEHAQGLLMKLLQRLLLTYDSLRESLGKEHILPAVSVVATIAVILAAGYIMAYLMRLEETRVQEEYSTKKTSSKKRRSSDNVPFATADTSSCHSNASTTGCHSNGGSCNSGNGQQLKLHEMRAETFNGLVRLLRPGCRTVLLLVDTQSRAKLLPKFHKIVWPYRKNKTLLFAHLNLDRGLAWYAQLLTLSLPEPRDLNRINPRNCIGTVLSLNGLRKYFCMYHAKHPECIGTRANKNGGDKYSQVIFQENLLDGLPNWLDRLFEGSTHRYYINYWPDFIGK
ncbi:hypothetical protein LSTR_LSTR012545 [Laodelphax striatellus]|uniref:DnaJ homolog subfamily C member 16 n=1 Tax=Laodelphax striatellus TaxID=195883 RepID=A0A482XSC2_LAOST|nr:hypothetical protein LSTR_LSTR012545 [Laodelphax striatellus]